MSNDDVFQYLFMAAMGLLCAMPFCGTLKRPYAGPLVCGFLALICAILMGFFKGPIQ